MNEKLQADAVIRTPDQRLRIFVSSTLVELADERRAVSRAITTLRLTPVMVELGARPHPPQRPGMRKPMPGNLRSGCDSEGNSSAGYGRRSTPRSLMRCPPSTPRNVRW